MNFTEQPFYILDQFVANNIHFFEIGLYILYSLIFLFGVIGNSIVIYVLMSSICINRSKMNKNMLQRELTTVNHNNLNQTNKFQYNNSFKTLVKHNELDKKQTELLIPQQQIDLINTNITQNKKNLNEEKNILQRISEVMFKFIKEKLTVTNFYLLNLAISDFFYLFFIPFLLCTIVTNKWLFGMLVCKLYFSLAYLCQCSSVFILVVLSVDRYLSVKYPLKTSTFRSDELARIVIFISWLLSFLFIIPVAMYTELKENSCLIDWPEKWNFSNQTSFTHLINNYLSPLHLFNIYTFLLNYVIPVSIIVILYTQILKSLSKNSLKNTATKQSKAKKKSHKHITKMVLTIIICYIVCWTPYWCYQIFIYFYVHVFKLHSGPFLIIVSHSVQIIAYMSSALNPFIYSYMSEAFRTNLNAALESCNCCFSVSTPDKIKQKELRELAQKEELNNLNNKETKNFNDKKKLIVNTNNDNNKKSTLSSITSLPTRLASLSSSNQNINFKTAEDLDCINTIKEEELISKIDNTNNNELSQDQDQNSNSMIKAIKKNKIKNSSNSSSNTSLPNSNSKSKSSPLNKNITLLNTSNSKFKFEINFHGFKNFKNLKKSNNDLDNND